MRACVHSQSCERIRGSLEQCQFGRDLDIFVRRNGTGTGRPDADGNLVAAGNLDAPPSARTTLSHRPPSLTGSLTSLSSSAGSTGSAPPTETLPSSLDDTASVASFPPASAVSDAGAPPPYFNSSQAPLFYGSCAPLVAGGGGGMCLRAGPGQLPVSMCSCVCFLFS